MRSRRRHPIDHTQQTVLVTGASAGIGAEFARQLAARGSDLVLVARRAERLDALADELRHACGVRVETVPMDLAQSGVGARLWRELERRGVHVTSVVNNAGFASVGPFHQIELSDALREIAVDVSAVVEITHAFLPGLRELGDSYLVNVASMAAYQADPTMAVYGACKAFVLSLTEALWYEARGTGLRVLALSPGATETEFFDVAGTGADGGARRMSAASVVETAIAALERRNPPPSIAAGRSNRAALVLGRLAGRRRTTELVGALMSRSG